MTEFSIQEFLGLTLILLPLIIFTGNILIRGTYIIFQAIIEEPDRGESIFHHHFHYKSK